MSDNPKHVRGERPVFLESRTLDNLLAMNLALVGEIAVYRDRLDTVERLLEEKGILSQAAVTDYVPSPEVLAARELRYAEYLDIVLQPLLQERAEAERKAERKGYDQVAEFVETN